MKRIVVLFVCLTTMMVVSAQDRKKFSPEKFEADMEAFITQEAGLTAQEAAKFFPLLREMHTKQRALYGQIRGVSKQKPSSEQGCEKAIQQCDKLNIELKKIEQQYHKRFLQVLPASKVYDAINAESKFHREVMKGWKKDRHH